MAVHCLEAIGTPPDGASLADVRDALRDWADQWNQRLPDQRTKPTVRRPPPYERVSADHVKAEWRFAYTHDADVIVEDARSSLQSLDLDWWVLRYHECSHDQATGDRHLCAWDNVWTGGQPPEEVTDA